MNKAWTPQRWKCIATPELEASAGLIESLVQKLHVSPLIARLLAQRGLSDCDKAASFLTPKLLDLHDPMLLPGMEKAATRLVKAVADKQPIVIYGDYDVDGVTASAILYHVLTHAGGSVQMYVPHRIDEGYGLNCQAIESLCDGLPTGPDGGVIVSVDCGVTACEPAAVAKARGVDLIITDHHQFNADDLPDVLAIVHPTLPGSAYPFGELCGAGVALKLAWAFARLHCGSQRVPETYRQLLLDMVSLAALGTVADIVPLVGENRVITTFGLGRIKHTSNLGLNALIDAASLRDEKVDAYHVGFVLGPRLNACGRMGHASKAVHLLTQANETEAREIAHFLTSENQKRQTVEADTVAEAKKIIEENGYHGPDRRAIVVAREGWHLGVAGIVASRLVEAYHRPAIVLCIDEEGMAHGSARSVDGVSIHDALQSCAKHLLRFGGHAMAAGMHLKASDIPAFRDALIACVNSQLREEDLCEVVTIHTRCSASDLAQPVVEQFECLAPFGRENPQPMLGIGDLRITQPPKRMGQSGKHLSMIVTDGQATMRAVGFGLGDAADHFAAGSRVDLACHVKCSHWQGRTNVELMVKSMRPAQGEW